MTKNSFLEEVIFKHISHFFLLFLLVILNKWMLVGKAKSGNLSKTEELRETYYNTWKAVI